MSILVVGSLALDSIQTPFGRVRDALGGSAVYFSTAASLFERVNLVGVVGDDFPAESLDFLRSRNIDLRGLQVAEGKTFRWSGRYDYDLNTAQTLDTQLNVFATFHPQIPEDYKDSKYVFLANIDPELQLEVLEQVHNPRLVVLDTMNYWIDYKRDALTEAFKRADVVIINEAEARQFGKTFSLIRAARKIFELGPKVLVIKRGEYGASMFAEGETPISSYFFVPAYPLEKIQDPTGAGDTFAGGFMGFLARYGQISIGAIKRAIVYGSVAASFVVEDFSVNRVATLTHDEMHARYEDFKHFGHFERFSDERRPTAEIWTRLAARE